MLGALILRELPHFEEILFRISALIGATIVIQPHFLFSGSAKSGNYFSDDHYCRSISAKPTSIQKEKDIPRLPEN